MEKLINLSVLLLDPMCVVPAKKSAVLISLLMIVINLFVVHVLVNVLENISLAEYVAPMEIL